MRETHSSTDHNQAPWWGPGALVAVIGLAGRIICAWLLLNSANATFTPSSPVEPIPAQSSFVSLVAIGYACLSEFALATMILGFGMILLGFFSSRRK